MAITINTNLQSMVVQKNLTQATEQMNQAIERMTTGYKINNASDNAATGADMLSTLEDNYALISSHIQRVRDLTEQASNGTYGEQSKKAIQAEIEARLQEVNRIAANCEFNGIKLMQGEIASTGLDIQVGIDGEASKSRINLDADLFANGDIENIFAIAADTAHGIDTAYSWLAANNTADKKVTQLAKDCAGLGTTRTASSMLVYIDKVINDISNRVTTLGAAQNRIESAIESIGVQSENITSSLSTLRDADVATESSNYIKSQILQQASATLLSTANQSPSIALNLL